MAYNSLPIRMQCIASLFIIGITFVCASAEEDLAGVESPPTRRTILVFGGNGFLGADTVEKLIASDDKVTIVNRGNWYWDSEHRIVPHVKWISCDRNKGIESCTDLLSLVTEVDRFDAVIDFSAYGPQATNESSRLLKDKVGLYILISTDSVYDVCAMGNNGKSKETDAVRPEDEEEHDLLSRHHDYGHRKLQAEEELLSQRQDGGFPFVILRLPDVIGPRDSTFRWLVYQIWIKLAPHLPSHPVTIPHFLENYPASFVYSKDVADTILSLLSMGPQVNDQAINLGYSQTFTVKEILGDIQSALDIKDMTITVDQNSSNVLYLYPSVRRGPIDVTKAEELLGWTPTAWQDAVRDTVTFHEHVMSGENFITQRDEVIQIVAGQVFRPDDYMEYYEALEKVYNIDLHHFTNRRDEL